MLDGGSGPGVRRSGIGELAFALSASVLRRLESRAWDVAELVGVPVACRATKKVGRVAKRTTAQLTRAAVVTTLFVAVICCILAAASGFGSVICAVVWRVWAPTDADLEYDFSFDYTLPTPRAELLLEPENAMARREVIAYPLEPWETYNFTLKLTVPETRHNFAIGMFTAVLSVRAAQAQSPIPPHTAIGEEGEECRAVDKPVLGRLSASSMLRVREHCYNTLWYSVFGSCDWPLVGSTEGVQDIFLPLEARWHPLHGEQVGSLELELSRPLQLYGSRLQVHAQKFGVSGWLQRRPKLTLFVVFLVSASAAGFSMFCFVAIVGLWIRSRSFSTEEEPEEEEEEEGEERLLAHSAPFHRRPAPSFATQPRLPPLEEIQSPATGAGSSPPLSRQRFSRRPTPTRSPARDPPSPPPGRAGSPRAPAHAAGAAGAAALPSPLASRESSLRTADQRTSSGSAQPESPVAAGPPARLPEPRAAILTPVPPVPRVHQDDGSGVGDTFLTPRSERDSRG
eukprot:Hpha_TRINITY_DN15997_c6_g2::TRINITY_DN15997_c6_g2_i1::g.70269::m.70269/K19365/BSCL2; seipin